jgi:signal transduction histidine kinase/DNA-binding NarL/FixJ family response regulator
MDRLVSRLEQAASPEPYYQTLQTVMRTATALDTRVRNYTVSQQPEELISEVRLTDSLRTQIDSLRSFEEANPRLDTIAGLLNMRVILMDSIVEMIKAQEGQSAFAAFYDQLKAANDYRRRRQSISLKNTKDTVSIAPVPPPTTKTEESTPEDDTLTAESFASQMTLLGDELNAVRIRISEAQKDSIRAVERVANWKTKASQRNTKYARNKLQRWEESLRDAVIALASARADLMELNEKAELLTDDGRPRTRDRVTVKSTLADSTPSFAKQPAARSESGVQELNRLLRKAKRMARRDSLNKLESDAALLQLTDRDMELTEEIIFQLEALEQSRQAAADNRADYARGLSKKTRQLAALFGAATVLILAFLLGIIFRDLNQNRRLQKNLASAKARAEALARAKEEFLANMSHEIRTPMNAIIGFSQALGEEQLSSKAAHSQRAITRSADHLLALLNDILDLSKLEAGQLKLESIPFSPAQVCQDAILLYEHQAKSKGLYLNLITSPDLPEALLGDPLRLRQILLNLVSNALKFTQKGGVSLHVYTKQGDGESVKLRLEVRDTGQGISPEAQKRIFQAFEQEDSSTARNHGGTGLGLAISARLVALQEGKIKVQSDVGKGATFSVTLPYQKAEKSDLPQKSPKKKMVKALKGVNVLAADDDAYNRELLAMLLDRWGLDYELVQHGQEAVDLAMKKQFDIILLDLRMPVLNGLEAAKKIREKHTEVPIIALTATATSKDKEQAKTIGIQDFLIKPYKPEDLATLINTYTASKPVSAVSHEEKEKPTAPVAPGYDPAKLEAMAKGNQAFIKKMLGLFTSNVKKQLPLWDEAQNKKDWDILSDIAHSLAPSVRQLGNDGLYQGLKKLEKDIEEGQKPEKDSKEIKEKLFDMLTMVESDLMKRD